MLDSKKENLYKIIKREAIITSDQRKSYGRDGAPQDWVFDIKKITLDPIALNLIADIFWQKYENTYPFQVGCQETAAIPLVSAIVCNSQQIGKPVNGFYIRKSRKKDGLQKIIEGKFDDNKIILVDDIINSGQTISRQINVIEEQGKKVSNVFTLVNYREETNYKFLKEKDIQLISLFPITEFGLELIKEVRDIPRNYFNVLWHFKSPNPEFFYVVPKSTPALDEDKIYFGSDSGYFWALDQKNGKVVWRHRIFWFSRKGIFSSPAICKENVYFGAYDGNIYCLNKETGKKKWIFMEADWVGSSPVISEDLNLLFIGLEFGLLRKQGGIVALNLNTGKKVWEQKMSKFVHCTPIYLKKKKMVAIGGNDGCVHLFGARNGKKIWTYQAGDEIKYSLETDAENKFIFFGSTDGNLYIIDVDSGELILRYKNESGIFSTPFIHGDNVIFSSLDKRIYNINFQKDEPNWIFNTSGRVFSSPVLIEGNIFVGSNDGKMYEIDKNNGKLISFVQFTERITNKIVYNPSSKRFFVLTQANEIYCLARQNSTKNFVAPGSAL